METRQIAYVTDTSDRIFLSRAACVDLGMISDSTYCNAAAAWSCERPSKACDGVRAHSTTGAATCRLSPARDAAHLYRASGAGPGRPSYAPPASVAPVAPLPPPPDVSPATGRPVCLPGIRTFLWGSL
ncbi:unnamed protein product [Arctogadus glacialis]